MQIPKKIGAIIGSVIIASVLAVLFFAHKSEPPIAFYCAGVSISSNVSYISIGISNKSSWRIGYSIGKPVLKTNGVWGALQFSNNTPIQFLGAGQSVTGVVMASSTLKEVKVPVLWGFTYSPKATKLQEIWEDVVAYLRMHDSRGRGALYTNYVGEIVW